METSPRLDDRYRNHMRGLVDYLASDFDERGHRADIHLDLQQIKLPDESIDVFLTPHVLEHVPDTERALAEIWRVLKPQGVALIMVPIPQARTMPPREPEFHGDNTPVFWRFGWDLTDKLKQSGFGTTILVTEELLERAQRRMIWGVDPTDVDPDDLLLHAGPYVEDMEVVASREVTRELLLEPVYYFIAFEGRKGG
ncbi:MAG: class I SAM-dependent methyltransferase [Candidatus Dormibacteraceae bacterium]